MRFPPQFIDELRQRLHPSAIVGRRVSLKSKGRGEFLGLCPFHSEKTPSFSVSDDKGFYHCFGCGAHGNIIDFLMDTQGLNFAEAVTSLAGEAGMALPQYDKKAEKHYQKIKNLYDVMESATAFFEKSLTESHEAKEYLENRGIDADIIRTFRIGFAPENRNAMEDFLTKDGCSKEQLIDTGLIIRRDGGSNYSRFRGRIMFPIMDTKGRIIAFGGRILGDGQPKYLNSPETELFHKGKILYGYHIAREKAYKKSAIVAVEGYMDVVALHKTGITNAVAPLGTAITEDHLRLLWNLAPEPVICMDGDRAGKAAMAKVAEKSLPFLEPGYSLNFTILPKGLDPDDFIKEEGALAMRKLLTDAKPLAYTLWDITLGGKKISTPEQKARFEERLMTLAGTIKNTSVQHYYRQDFRDKLWQKYRKTGKAKVTDIKTKEINLINHVNISHRKTLEDAILTTILNYPQLLLDNEIEDDFIRIEFSRDLLNDIRTTIFEAIAEQEEEINISKFYSDLEKHSVSSHIEQLRGSLFKELHVNPAEAHETSYSLAKMHFNYLIASYNLGLLEEEYSKLVENKVDQSNERAIKLEELNKQRILLKKLAEKEKMSYEAALDD